MPINTDSAPVIVRAITISATDIPWSCPSRVFISALVIVSPPLRRLVECGAGGVIKDRATEDTGSQSRVSHRTVDDGCWKTTLGAVRKRLYEGEVDQYTRLGRRVASSLADRPVRP